MPPDWSIYDSDIKDFYINQNNTARNTLNAINQKYRTNITLRQFKSEYGRLKNWQAEEWMAVICAIQAGKTRGREYEVYRLNRRQEKERVKTAFRLYEKRARGGRFPHIDLGIDTVDKHHIEIRTLASGITTPPLPTAADDEQATTTTEVQSAHNDYDHGQINSGVFIPEICPVEIVGHDMSTPGLSSLSNFFSPGSQINRNTSTSPHPIPQLSLAQSLMTAPDCGDIVSPEVQQNPRDQLLLPATPALESLACSTVCFTHQPKPSRSAYGSFWDMPEILGLFPTLRDNGESIIKSFYFPDIDMTFRDGSENISGWLSSYLIDANPKLMALSSIALQTEAIISNSRGKIPILREDINQESLYQMFCIVLYLASNNQFEISHANMFLRWTIDNGFTNKLLEFLQQTSSYGVNLISCFSRALLYRTQSYLGANRSNRFLHDYPDESFKIISMADSRALSTTLGYELLCNAICYNDIRLTEFLLSKGVDIEFEGPDPGQGPIEWAVMHDSIDVLKLIIRSKKIINEVALSTALVSALHNSNIEAAEVVLERVTRFDVSLWVGEVPILKWTKKNSPELDKIIWEKLVHDEMAENYLLTEAAEKGNRMLTQKLLQLELLPDEVLERVLCYAIKEGNHGAVRTLLSRGVDPTVQRYRAHEAKLGRDDEDEEFDPLLLAAKSTSRDIGSVLYLLRKHGVLIDTSTMQKIIGLDNSFDSFDYFALAGFDIEIVGPSAIESAIENNEYSFLLCSEWLDQGSPMNDYGVQGLSALQAAARYGHLTMTVDLIERGAAVNLPASEEGGMTALQAAACSRDPDVVDCLLDAGANCRAPPAKNNGYTVLEAATHICGMVPDDNVRHEEIVLGILKTLLCNEAPVNRLDGTASRLLLNVIINNWMSCLELLLRAGAKPQGTSILTRRPTIDPTFHPPAVHRNVTPLQAAAYFLDLNAMQMLCEYGADIHAPAEPSTGLTVLQAAISSDDEQSNERLSVREVVDWLLIKGVDVNAPASERDGRTALQAAISTQNPDPILVKLLLDHGTDVNAPAARVRGITALQAAAGRGNLQIAKMLLAREANVNAPAAPVEGRTAIEAAAEHGSMEMVKLLLDHDADPRTGFSTAIKLARENDHWHIVDFLDSHLQTCNSLSWLECLEHWNTM